MNPCLEHLTSIYAKWLTVNNISQTMSAEDLLYENNIYQITLTKDQVKFLKSFVNIWCEIDNFDYEDTRKAVKLIGNKCLTESSGNINEATIRHYAECGVNFISCGALTHSVHNMDLSLKAMK